MGRRLPAYNPRQKHEPSGKPMPEDQARPQRTKWLSWLTLLAGAVMCVVAVLMS
jgi:hypothetical protein